MPIDMEEFRKLNFKGAKITGFDRWVITSDDSLHTLGIKGDFAEYSDAPYFDCSFSEFTDNTVLDGDFSGAEIVGFEVLRDELFHVNITVKKDEKTEIIGFSCKIFSVSQKKYRGMSYKNMYSGWVKNLAGVYYVEDGKYFVDEENHLIEDGFELHIKNYADVERKNPQYLVIKAKLAVCELTGEGLKYRYRSTSSGNPHTFFDFIHHKNGHRYFPFHIDLYGISYLDLESGEAYHYIPEGYEHDVLQMMGESFIITDVHYDANTSLIAYNGCYWGGTSDVMVGDFSDPLNFAPKLISIYSIIDPEYDDCDDINFMSFEENGIVVATYDKREFFIEFKDIYEKLSA